MFKNTGVFPAPSVATTGQSLVSHAGLNVLASFIDATDVRDLYEDRLGQFVPSGAAHGPGTILGSLALMLAPGGKHVSDLDILRSSPGVFGKVASNATLSRFFERTVSNPSLFDYGFATMSRELRSRVWVAAGDRNPALRATVLDPLIIDLGATLVTSHSKEQAVGTYKGGTGLPFRCQHRLRGGFGTGEILAVALRPGNAGASRKFLNHLAGLGVQFSVSYPVPVAKARTVGWISDKQYWEPALHAAGEERTNAWVVNATAVMGLEDYPEGTNLYLRAEPLHPGAQASLVDADGHFGDGVFDEFPALARPHSGCPPQGPGQV